MSIYKYNEKYGWTEIEPGTPAFGKTQNQIYANLKKNQVPPYNIHVHAKNNTFTVCLTIFIIET